MVPRMSGLAMVADIEVLIKRAHIERMTLQLGQELITQRDQFRSIEEDLEHAKFISPLQQSITNHVRNRHSKKQSGSP